MRLMLKTMLTKAPDSDVFEAARGLPLLADPQLAQHNNEWMATAEKQDLNLIGVPPQQMDALTTGADTSSAKVQQDLDVLAPI
jgi:hypothetical protein